MITAVSEQPFITVGVILFPVFVQTGAVFCLLDEDVFPVVDRAYDVNP